MLVELDLESNLKCLEDVYNKNIKYSKKAVSRLRNLPINIKSIKNYFEYEDIINLVNLENRINASVINDAKNVLLNSRLYKTGSIDASETLNTSRLTTFTDRSLESRNSSLTYVSNASLDALIKDFSLKSNDKIELRKLVFLFLELFSIEVKNNNDFKVLMDSVLNDLCIIKDVSTGLKSNLTKKVKELNAKVKDRISNYQSNLKHLNKYDKLLEASIVKIINKIDGGHYDVNSMIASLKNSDNGPKDSPVCHCNYDNVVLSRIKNNKMLDKFFFNASHTQGVTDLKSVSSINDDKAHGTLNETVTYLKKLTEVDYKDDSPVGNSRKSNMALSRRVSVSDVVKINERDVVARAETHNNTHSASSRNLDNTSEIKIKCKLLSQILLDEYKDYNNYNTYVESLMRCCVTKNELDDEFRLYDEDIEQIVNDFRANQLDSKNYKIINRLIKYYVSKYKYYNHLLKMIRSSANSTQVHKMHHSNDIDSALKTNRNSDSILSEYMNANGTVDVSGFANYSRDSSSASSRSGNDDVYPISCKDSLNYNSTNRSTDPNHNEVGAQAGYYLKTNGTTPTHHMKNDSDRNFKVDGINGANGSGVLNGRPELNSYDSIDEDGSKNEPNDYKNQVLNNLLDMCNKLMRFYKQYYSSVNTNKIPACNKYIRLNSNADIGVNGQFSGNMVNFDRKDDDDRLGINNYINEYVDYINAINNFYTSAHFCINNMLNGRSGRSSDGLNNASNGNANDNLSYRSNRHGKAVGLRDLGYDDGTSLGEFDEIYEIMCNYLTSVLGRIVGVFDSILDVMINISSYNDNFDKQLDFTVNYNSITNWMARYYDKSEKNPIAKVENEYIMCVLYGLSMLYKNTDTSKGEHMHILIASSKYLYTHTRSRYPIKGVYKSRKKSDSVSSSVSSTPKLTCKQASGLDDKFKLSRDGSNLGSTRTTDSTDDITVRSGYSTMGTYAENSVISTNKASTPSDKDDAAFNDIFSTPKLCASCAKSSSFDPFMNGSSVINRRPNVSSMGGDSIHKSIEANGLDLNASFKSVCSNNCRTASESRSFENANNYRLLDKITGRSSIESNASDRSGQKRRFNKLFKSSNSINSASSNISNSSYVSTTYNANAGNLDPDRPAANYSATVRGKWVKNEIYLNINNYVDYKLKLTGEALCRVRCSLIDKVYLNGVMSVTKDEIGFYSLFNKNTLLGKSTYLTINKKDIVNLVLNNTAIAMSTSDADGIKRIVNTKKDSIGNNKLVIETMFSRHSFHVFQSVDNLLNKVIINVDMENSYGNAEPIDELNIDLDESTLLSDNNYSLGLSEFFDLVFSSNTDNKSVISRSRILLGAYDFKPVNQVVRYYQHPFNIGSTSNINTSVSSDLKGHNSIMDTAASYDCSASNANGATNGFFKRFSRTNSFSSSYSSSGDSIVSASSSRAKSDALGIMIRKKLDYCVNNNTLFNTRINTTENLSYYYLKDQIVYQSLTNVRDMPYSKHFYTVFTIVVSNTAVQPPTNSSVSRYSNVMGLAKPSVVEKQKKINVKIYSNVVFNKKIMFEKVIKSEAMQKMTQATNIIVDAMKDHLLDNNIQIKAKQVGYTSHKFMIFILFFIIIVFKLFL